MNTCLTLLQLYLLTKNVIAVINDEIHDVSAAPVLKFSRMTTYTTPEV